MKTTFNLKQQQDEMVAQGLTDQEAVEEFGNFTCMGLELSVFIKRYRKMTMKFLPHYDGLVCWGKIHPVCMPIKVGPELREYDLYRDICQLRPDGSEPEHPQFLALAAPFYPGDMPMADAYHDWGKEFRALEVEFGLPTGSLAPGSIDEIVAIFIAMVRSGMGNPLHMGPDNTIVMSSTLHQADVYPREAILGGRPAWSKDHTQPLFQLNCPATHTNSHVMPFVSIHLDKYLEGKVWE